MRRPAVLLAAMAVLLALGGCVSLPESGAVRAAPVREHVEDDGTLDYTPGGPKQGATPGTIVEGFLVAMTATPVNTSVARQYLTDASSRSWVPEQGTIVYGTKQVGPGTGRISVDLGDTVQLDGRGEWLGDPTHGQGVRLRLHLVREAGEWRISDPPNALIVPTVHFASTFTQYFLYFFDKSSQVLVPEPVYVPRGAQAPTVLVSGLLRGPDRALLGVERTFFPARTKLDDLSVPVSRDGTAQVPLTDEVLDLDTDGLNLMFAQLAWTLGQIPGVERLRITVDGSPLDLPGEGADVPVGAWTEYDPAVAWASQSLFGLRDGRVSAVVDGAERRVSGLFGGADLAISSFGVDLPAENIAAVTDGGTRVKVAARNRTPGTQPGLADATTVYQGYDVRRPVYDLNGQLWLLDRTRRGARILVVRNGIAREVDAPGITGTRVTAFAVSRDGTRLIAGVRGTGTDHLVLARVQREPDGRVRGVTPAVPLDLGVAANEPIRDLAWRTPGTIAVLTGPAPTSSQVVVVPVDGSTAPGDLVTDAEPFQDRAVSVVTAPTLGAPLYVGTPTGQLFSLAATGRWTTAGIDPGFRAAAFVG